MSWYHETGFGPVSLVPPRSQRDNRAFFMNIELPALPPGVTGWARTRPNLEIALKRHGEEFVRLPVDGVDPDTLVAQILVVAG